MANSKIVSLTVFIVIVFLVIIWVITWDIRWFFVFITGVTASILAELLKDVIKEKRPPGACDCNFISRGGNAEQKNGMPSGHVAVATAIAYAMWIQNLVPNTLLYAILLLSWISAVIWSRLDTKCHTVKQVAAGFTLGALVAHPLSLQ